MTDGFRSQGIRKSKFPARTTLDTNDTFDFVAGDGTNTNYKITFNNLLTELGATGTMVAIGDVADVPVLDKQGSVNGIRNIKGGTGITVTQHASGSIEISLTQDDHAKNTITNYGRF